MSFTTYQQKGLSVGLVLLLVHVVVARRNVLRKVNIALVVGSVVVVVTHTIVPQLCNVTNVTTHVVCE